MAIYKFVKSALNNKKIELFNYGKNKRDFTYVDDLIDILLKLLNKKNKKKIPYQVLNIGSENPISINNLVKKLSKY